MNIDLLKQNKNSVFAQQIFQQKNIKDPDEYFVRMEKNDGEPPIVFADVNFRIDGSLKGGQFFELTGVIPEALLREIANEDDSNLEIKRKVMQWQYAQMIQANLCSCNELIINDNNLPNGDVCLESDDVQTFNLITDIQ